MTGHEEAINIGIARAHQSVREAILLLDNWFYEAGVSRLYYSCFYIVRALLLSINIVPATHKGIQQMFGKHYVVRGIVSKETGRFFSELFFMRQESDYKDLSEIKEAMALDLLAGTKSFIAEIEQLIKTQKL